MPDVTSSQKLVLEGEDLREYQEFLHSKVASTTMSTALIPETFPVTKTTTTPKTTFSAKIVNRQALILDITLLRAMDGGRAEVEYRFSLFF